MMVRRRNLGGLSLSFCYTSPSRTWDILMFDTKFLDELAARIGDAVRASPAKDLEKNVRALLGTLFTRLDLVTREEFEVQAQVLLRTREKLEQLEARLQALEEPPAAP